MNVSGRPAPEFLKTSLRPSEMTSLEAKGGFLDLGVGFECGIDGDDQCRISSVSRAGYATGRDLWLSGSSPATVTPPPPPLFISRLSGRAGKEFFIPHSLLIHCFLISNASMAYYNVFGELKNTWIFDNKLRSEQSSSGQ